MLPTISCGMSRQLDATTREKAKISGLQLMEIASLRLWDEMSEFLTDHSPLLLDGEARSEIPEKELFENLSSKGKGAALVAVCGKGDNAGDALAMLRHAKFEGFENLSAIMLFDEISDSAEKNLESATALGISIYSWERGEKPQSRQILEKADLILDGILGTGLKGEARGPAAEMIDLLNSLRAGGRRALLAAIDLPSGLGDDWREGYRVLKSDLTLAISPMKSVIFESGTRELCGVVRRIDGVFPENLTGIDLYGQLLCEDDIEGLVPYTHMPSYKKTRGRLAIFAGSKGALGAAILCAKSALASGAGYVALFADEDVAGTLAQAIPSVMVRPFPGSRFDPSSWDCVLAGPGWGRGPGRIDLLRTLCESGAPLVLDADAIRLMPPGSGEKPRKPGAPLLLTPHLGEFRALLGSEEGNPIGVSSREALKVALREDAIVVLKAATTSIVSKSAKIVFWDGMCPALGTAGSGDVLAGLIAGIFARRMAGSANSAEDPWDLAFDSASLGVAVHGVAGKSLWRSRGWYSSEELVPECAKILGKPKKLIL